VKISSFVFITMLTERGRPRARLRADGAGIRADTRELAGVADDPDRHAGGLRRRAEASREKLGIVAGDILGAGMDEKSDPQSVGEWLVHV